MGEEIMHNLKTTKGEECKRKSNEKEVNDKVFWKDGKSTKGATGKELKRDAKEYSAKEDMKVFKNTKDDKYKMKTGKNKAKDKMSWKDGKYAKNGKWKGSIKDGNKYSDEECMKVSKFEKDEKYKEKKDENETKEKGSW